MLSVLSALREPGFGRLAASYTINQVGDWVGAIALAILVFDQTGDALATTALFLAAKVVPAFLAPALTARLDQGEPKRALVGLYAAEAAIFALLAYVATRFWLPAILALAVVDGTLALTARGLTRGAVAVLLERSGRLREGNAVLNVGFAVSTALGPALGGLLVAAGDVPLALLVDAASFAVVAVLLATARALPRPQHEPDAGWRRRLVAGLAYVRRTQALRLLVLGEGVAIVFFTVVIPIEVVYAKQALGTGDAGYGLFTAAWGTGIVLGSLLYAAAKDRSPVLLVAASTAAIGAAYVGIAAAPTLAVACAISVVGGTGNGVQWVAVVTALQAATPAAYQARISGLLESVAAAAPGIGFVLGGVLTAAASPRLAYAVAGAAVLVLVALGAALYAHPRARSSRPAER